jgi:2-dehydro-3-deoxygluconokinase
MKMDFLTVGEPLVCFDSGDLPLDRARSTEVYAVGAESNVAIGLARLGREAGFIGRVGTDSAGRLVLRTLRGEGVDVSAVRVVAGRPTGVILKETCAPARVEVTYHRADSAGSTIDVDDIPSHLDGVRHVHVTGITLVLSETARATALELMRRAREAGATVSLDANFRRKLAPASVLVQAFEDAARLADIVFIGRREAELCADGADLDGYLRSLTADVVILKGAHGGATVFVNGATESVDAHETVVVDPVGAGDAFVVGFLHAWFDGRDLRAALEQAGRVAAHVIGTRGDYQGLPYPADLVNEPDQGLVLR